MRYRLLLCCLLSPLALVSTFANAELLAPQEELTPVIKHLKHDSNFSLRASSSKKRNAPATYDGFVMSYKLDPSVLPNKEMPKGVGTYDAKPNCTAAEVRRKPVVYESRELERLDVLYYNYRDASQSKQAALWKGPTAPYLEGDLSNPYRDRTLLQQEFGRLFELRCLPTRAHYVLVNGQWFEEYREGSSAWDVGK